MNSIDFFITYANELAMLRYLFGTAMMILGTGLFTFAGMAAMIFDTPGSEKLWGPYILFWTIITLPITFYLSAFGFFFNIVNLMLIPILISIIMFCIGGQLCKNAER